MAIRPKVIEDLAIESARPTIMILNGVLVSRAFVRANGVPPPTTSASGYGRAQYVLDGIKSIRLLFDSGICDNNLEDYLVATNDDLRKLAKGRFEQLQKEVKCPIESQSEQEQTAPK